MSQINMLDAIGDKMDALDFDGDLSLNWDKDAHVIELEITMTVQSESGIEVEDQSGETVDNGPVEYQDAILFYDETRLHGEDYADDYLAVFGFNGKKGIDKATVDALFIYLQDFLDDSESDLMDFVDGTSDDDTFVLNFDDAAFERILTEQPEEDNRIFFCLLYTSPSPRDS